MSAHRCWPTGLVLALWLTRLGVKGRIVNKTAELGATSRALGGPSCEHSNSTDSLTSPITVVAHGHKVPAVNLRAQWKLGVLPFMQFRLFYE